MKSNAYKLRISTVLKNTNCQQTKIAVEKNKPGANFMPIQTLIGMQPWCTTCSVDTCSFFLRKMKNNCNRYKHTDSANNVYAMTRLRYQTVPALM